MRIRTSDDETIEFDAELLARYSRLAHEMTTDAGADAEQEIPLTVPARHLEHVKRYAEHHGNAETAAPAPPLPHDATRESMLREDKWDVEFFERVARDENDVFMVEFIRSIDYLQIDTLMAKATMVAAIALVESCDGMLDAKKIGDAINSIAKRDARNKPTKDTP